MEKFLEKFNELVALVKRYIGEFLEAISGVIDVPGLLG